MTKAELLGVLVSVEPGYIIQLLDDKDGNTYLVHKLNKDGGTTSEVKRLSYKEPGTKDAALVAALDEFVKRIRAEREGRKVFVPIEEFALVLNSSGDAADIGDYHTFSGHGETPEASISEAEDKIIEQGMYDIEELRNNSDYSASIAALLRSAQETEHTGIALLIR